jgi:CHAD domain-containing protein
MTSEHLEVERKFEVGDRVPWVDLAELPAVRAVGSPSVSSLEAAYYDTDRLALVRAGITLRRRVGGPDSGWHLELPSGSGDRVEFGEPLGPDDEPVPASLVDLVRAWVRDHQLRPVAALRTSRTVQLLIGDSDAVLAEAADDVVTARALGNGAGPTVSHWREWEIELIDGSTGLLEAAGARMVTAGATASGWHSKLEHALHDRLAELPARPRLGTASPRSRAGDIVFAHLVEQVDAMLTRDRQARYDEPDGVHKMRVATRRLRSALATFRPLLDRAVTDPLRAELKWIAAELGRARDAEVLRMRLLDEIAQEPGELVLGPISSRIEAELSADHRTAHDALVLAMNSDRYYRLLDRLDQLIEAPPWTRLADGRADKVLTRRIRKSYGRVERLVSAGAPRRRGERDEWYHEIRKAAKRLRYAAESVEPAFGTPAADLAEAAETLQEVLGEHQDSVVARLALRDLGAMIHLDGDNAFTIGRLHALEQVRGQDAVARFRPAWQAVSSKRMLRWLKS